jgi:hypothetical protein
MFKEGNFAMVLVKCVKISLGDFSPAYRLVFAGDTFIKSLKSNFDPKVDLLDINIALGHSNNHFRLLQENDPLSNKVS